MPSFDFLAVLVAYACVSQSRKLSLQRAEIHDHAHGTSDVQCGMSTLQQQAVKGLMLAAQPMAARIIARIDGSAPPVVWGEAMRELQAGGELDWDWEAMVDWSLLWADADGFQSS
jgi:hypothetical protein